VRILPSVEAEDGKWGRDSKVNAMRLRQASIDGELSFSPQTRTLKFPSKEGSMRPGSGMTIPDEALSSRLASRIGRHKYDMWFDQTTQLTVDGSRVQVAASSQIVADWIGSHFAGDLQSVAEEVLGAGARVEVAVTPSLFDGARPRSPVEDAVMPPGRVDSSSRQRNRTDDARPGRTGGERRRNWWRRFDDFVVGDSNRLAHEASLRIAQSPPGSHLGMVFLHGECGVGKTHLLQGSCQRYLDLNPSHAVRYTTGEQFTNEYIAALRSTTLDEFRAKVRKLDLLAIDDVHFLANKTATQSEFLHTLDAIDFSGARVLLASDEHPRLIKRFSQSLVSRFLSGMVVRIEPPDRSTRVALIRRLAAIRSLRISPAAEELIVSRCLGSVRELEGALTKLAALSMISNSSSDEVGVLLVEQLLRDHGPRPTMPIRIADVVSAVTTRLAVDRSELLSNGRHRRVVLARGLAAYLARELTTLSFPEIARALGRENHSTAHTADARIRQMLLNDDSIEDAKDGAVLKLRHLVDEIRHGVLRAATAT
jgi:chromosomal replication initiator protein